MKCEICGSRECVDLWKICGHCYKERLECARREDAIRRECKKANERLIGTTTPGFRYDGASVNERRGRKLTRPAAQDIFLEGSEDELE